jgi:uncharacterized damage-inducible protein DinB
VEITDIRRLYEYLFWAHDRMMVAVSRLSQEEFTRDMGSSFPSIRDTLVHVMSVEWLSLSRWHGVFPDTMLDPEAFPTFAALEQRWDSIRRELKGYLGRVHKEHLNNLYIYRDLQGDEVRLPLYATLLQLINHHNYHRGQVTTLLRQLGHTPIETGLYRFYIEERVLEEAENVEEVEEVGSPIPQWERKEERG